MEAYFYRLYIVYKLIFYVSLSLGSYFYNAKTRNNLKFDVKVEKVTFLTPPALLKDTVKRLV